MAGDGLAAVYSVGPDFSEPVFARVDPGVNFAWDGAPPGQGVAGDRFGVRWTGEVMAPVNSPVTFHVRAEGGARLWIDGRLVVDNGGVPGEKSGTVHLRLGLKSRITLEYQEEGGPAGCVLSWSAPGLPRQPVPQSALSSGEPGRGLSASYFNGEDLNDRLLTRLEPSVDFEWGVGSPDRAVPDDRFSVRWAGQVLIDRTETYTFTTFADDGVRLWVDGKLLIDNWSVRPEAADSAEVTLKAGQKYDIVLEYFERQGGATCKLLWSSPTVPQQIIPTANLFPAGNGSGLTATYFNDTRFDSVALTRTDPGVNFNWRGWAPADGVNADNFSVRWAGQVVARDTELYTFYVNSDDGARLWVDGKLVVEKWGALGERSGTIPLAGGRSYDIVLEYVEWEGSADCVLSWSTPTAPKQVIPATSLYPSGAGTGLNATYFDGKDLARPVLSRLDAQVNHNWWLDAPAPGLAPSNFSVRWTGEILAPQSGPFTFYAGTDDGVRLWVDGKLVIDDWNTRPPAETSGTVNLVAGKKYVVVMEYYQAEGVALANLSWSSPLLPRQVIPRSSLYPAGTDRGLTATYFNDATLTAPAMTRVDPVVNFNWDQGSPGVSVKPDGFSVRWTGQVLASYSETYTFWTRGDDGVRLWVDGRLVIDDWNTHAPADRWGSAALTAGERHDITLEYYEASGGASVSLLWSSPSQPREVVPRTALFPNAAVPTTTTATAAPTPPPLPGDWTLAFREEFDTVDPGVWGGRPWWGNDGGHDSRYEPDNLSLFGGVLTIDARQEASTLLNGQQRAYSSGYLSTAGVKGVTPTRYAFQYGYAEVRARAAVGSGLWSAFWMLPASHKDDHLEIDVMEGQGWNTRQYVGGYHQWASGSGPWGEWDVPFDVTEDFHNYAVEWTPDRLSFYADGVEMTRLNDPGQIPQQAMQLIVSLEVTDWDWIGGVTTGGAGMAVDYVRVWQRNAATTPAPAAPPAEVRFDDPGFESPAQPRAGVAANPADTGWSYQGDAGVRADGSPLNGAKAPEGRQAAYLGTPAAGAPGSISQSIQVPAGRYKLTFEAAQRAGYGAQPVEVLVDGRVVGTVTPDWTEFEKYATPEFDLGAGAHTFTFAATAGPGGRGAFVDAVRLVKVSEALEGGWTAGDIGDPQVPGSSTAVGGTFLVTGTGAGLESGHDEFRFVSQNVGGDATLTARLSSQSKADHRAKAGVMFRASDAPDSAWVALLKTPSHGILLLWRDAQGNLGTTEGPVVWGPVTFRLVRQANTFTAFYATDGVTFNPVGGPVDVPLPDDALAGLAVTSNNPLAGSAAAFDSVSLTQA